MTRRNGFTLIEMVAAMIVVAMLMAVLTTFTRSIARQGKRAEAIRRQYPGTAILEDQILRDLRNADGMEAEGDGLTLFGALSSQPISGMGTHQLAQVQYRAGVVAGTRVLVRLEQTVGGAGHRRVVWFDAGNVAVQSLQSSRAKVNPHETGGLRPMPLQMLVTLSNAEGATIWSRRIRHHEEL